MDDLNDDDDSLEKRVPKWKLAIKFAKLIAKYGKRAWTYIYCVGTAPFWKCGDEVCNFPILLIPSDPKHMISTLSTNGLKVP
jgi:hypothetical protein